MKTNFRFGFCKKKAQKYKMTYSMPMTNQTTYPVPLIPSARPSLSERGGGGGVNGGSGGQQRKISHDFNEDYV